MKFLCQGLELADAVLKVVKAAAVRTTNLILECIKISAENDSVVLTCTDLELTITKTIKAQVKMEGTAVINAKLFADFVSKISSESLEFCLKDNVMEIRYADNTVSLQCQNAEEFPAPHTLENPNYVEIRSDMFKDLVTKASVAVAQDDSRPMLRGILLEVTENELRGVALDGVRMALVRKKIVSSSAEFGIIVPARCLLEIVRLLPETDETIRVCTQKNHLEINLGDTVLRTRLLGMKSDYVSYEQIMPKTFGTVITVNRQHLLDTIERASLLARAERNYVVKFNIQSSQITINSESTLGNITEHWDITQTGNDLLIEFNGRLYTDALRVISDEFIKVSYVNSTNPCVITPTEGNDFLYLVLPMRPM